MTKINHLMSLSGIIVFVILLSSCSSNKPLVKLPTPIKVGTYNYSPPSVATAKSAKVAFALINPNYATGFQWKNIDPFKKFADAMGSDLNALVIARGYSLRGPYASRGEMVYSDKIETDLALEITIELNLDYKNVKCIHHKYTRMSDLQPVTTIKYTYAGDIIIDGNIILTASETQTMEKLWTKKIPLSQENIPILSDFEYFNCDLNDFQNNGFLKDAGICNPIVTFLEKYYQNIMQTAWNHLDPLEMQSLKPQVDKIRANKKF